MLFTRRIDHSLNVIEVKELVDKGVTYPVRCRLSDKVDAYVKYPRNPAGIYTLINEWVGNSIADVIGLSIPRYGQCYLSENVIETTNVNEEIDSRNQGTCFFSSWISNTGPSNRRMFENADNRETERLILFDHLVNNEDRHYGNLLCEVSDKRRVYFIDCSHIIIPNTRNLNSPLDLEWELSDGALLNDCHLSNDDNNLYDILCETMGYREDVLYSEYDNIEKALTPEVMKEIKNSIPTEWVNSSTNQRINDMFIVLEKRRSRLRDITDMIAVERRKRQWKKY